VRVVPVEEVSVVEAQLKLLPLLLQLKLLLAPLRRSRQRSPLQTGELVHGGRAQLSRPSVAS